MNITPTSIKLYSSTNQTSQQHMQKNLPNFNGNIVVDFKENVPKSTKSVINDLITKKVKETVEAKKKDSNQNNSLIFTVYRIFDKQAKIAVRKLNEMIKKKNYAKYVNIKFSKD